MTLKRGFLRPDSFLPSPSGIVFWRGIILSFLFSLAFYSFMVICREGLRFAFTVGSKLVVLSEKETNFYNLIFSYIALITGLSVCFHHWLGFPSDPFSGRSKYIKKAVLNESRFIVLLFLVWFFRLASLYGAVGMDYCSFSLFPRYNYLFILILVVLFLNQWITILRVYKIRGMRWMLISLLIIVPSGFLMSGLKIIDQNAVNLSVLKKTPEYVLKMDVMRVKHCIYPQKKSLLETAYYGYPRNHVDPHHIPSVFYDEKVMSVSEFIFRFKQAKEKYSGWEKNRIQLLLYVDKDVTMAKFDTLKNRLIENDISEILLGVYPFTKYYCYPVCGTPLKLPGKGGSFNRKYKDLMDYLSETETDIYSLLVIDFDHRVLKINDNDIEENNFSNILYRNLSGIPKCFIELKPGGEVTFGEYITLSDRIKDVLRKLKEEESVTLFGKKYDELNLDEKRELSGKYERYLVRISDYYQSCFEQDAI